MKKRILAFLLAVTLALGNAVVCVGEDNLRTVYAANKEEKEIESMDSQESFVEENVMDETEEVMDDVQQPEEIPDEQDTSIPEEQQPEEDTDPVPEENEEDPSIVEEDSASAKKQVININNDWLFTKDGESQNLNLPHCWEYVHPTQSYIPAMNQKTVTYTKNIDVSDYKDKRVFLKFYAVNKTAKVYVNDQLAGEHIGGFSAFTVDITDYLTSDIVEIKVENTNIDTTSIPINSDFTHFAGLYRDVELIVCDDAYISVEDYGTSGIYVDQTLSGNTATVSVRTNLSSRSEENKSYILKTEILDESGQSVADEMKAVILAANEQNQEQKSVFELRDPHLWNGTIDPYLYTVKVSLLDQESNVLDEGSEKIGIRTFEVKGGDFYLNGELYELHGVGMHQDREDCGNVTTKEMKKEDFDNIKEMGANAVRTAHYAHDQYIYDLADEYGFVVWSEIPFYMIMADTEVFRESTKQQLVELIRQSYNHPSIICWGIQNEVNTNEAYKQYGEEFEVDTATLTSFMKELATLAKTEDPSRFVVQAHIAGTSKLEESLNWTLNSDIDYTGFNLYYGFKSSVSSADETGVQKIKDQYKKAINEYADMLSSDSLVISEYGAGGNIDQHATIDENFSWSGKDNDEPEHPEEWQSFVHEAAYSQIQEQDNVWVAFIWNMFDFSCYRNQAGKERLNNKGLMTYDHETKKDVFYFYKANWNKDDKFVYITSRRKTKRTEEDSTIKVYSNCEKVKLYINGQDLGYGTKQQDGVFVWDNVTYVNKKNTIKAVGEDGGQMYLDEIEVSAMVTGVAYSTHVQTYGWQEEVKNGNTAGTTGESKRLEGIKIHLLNADVEGSIEYQTHVQSFGWQEWKKDGDLSGTTGEGKRLEAIRIRLTDEMSEEYDVYYRVHAQTYGWLDWAKNGEPAGTVGQSKRLEAIQVVLVEKGDEAPGNTDEPFVQDYVKYQTHIQTYGWQGWCTDGQISGTSGESKRLEGLKIKLNQPLYDGNIEYKVHVQTYGWQDWKKNGATAGTEGQSKRLEAVQIRLTGEMAEYYDIYYRVHAQTYGWLDWAKNGESAGSEGQSKRLEAIEIRVIKKGADAPGETGNAFVQ